MSRRKDKTQTINDSILSLQHRPTDLPASTTRRSFCKTALAGLSVASGGLNAISALAANETLPHQAFSSSFENVPDSFGPTRVSFDKRLPIGLQGTLYRNGPAKMQRGNTRYQHWFDGDGMVHAFTLESDSVVHHGKMVRTDRLIEEEKAGRFLRSGFGTAFDHSLPISHPDDVNTGNISVLPIGDEVLALWEAGSPWRLDANTLDTLGRQILSAETDGLPFSAHPRIDPTGKIWNFGYLSGSGKLVLYELESNGQLVRASIIEAPNADMVHDFAITERYLIFVLLPLHFNDNTAPTMAFADRLQWNDNDPVHVLAVDKQTLQIAHRFELPAFFTFHLGNAWQDAETIHIEVAKAPPFTALMTQIIQATTGKNPGNSTLQPGSIQSESLQPETAEIVLDLKAGSAKLNPLPTSGIDFPRFDQRYTGQRTQSLFMLGRSETMPDAVFGFNTVTAMNRKTDTENRYDYGNHTIAEEHLFVPAPGNRQGKGWLVGTSYNWQTKNTFLSVFNAEHVDDGPVATAKLPYALPLGLHGQFV